MGRRIRGAKLGFERGERLCPRLVQPLAERAKAVRIDVVDAARAFGAVGDQARLLQYLEVLRDRGSAHRKRARELAHRRGSGLEPFEDLAAGRVRERSQRRCVSHGLR